MGFFDSLFNSDPDSMKNSADHSEDIQQIVNTLESYEPEKARYLAALSLLLGRVAYADFEFSDDEEKKIRTLLHEKLHLSAEDATLAASIARKRTLTPSIENHIFVKVIKDNTDSEQRQDILAMLFEVAGSESGISGEENEEIRLISKGLAINHDVFIKIRSQFREQLNVLKK